MLALLLDSCRSLWAHFLHCFLYALPAQAVLALTFYLLEADAHMGVVFASVVLFFILNTVYIYSGTQQMMKRKSGAVDFIGALQWRSAHFDFFLYVAVGMIALSVLAVYFIDAVNNQLMPKVEMLTRMQSEARLAGDIAGAQSYTVIVTGSKMLSYGLLAVVLLIWARITRIGIRIPAYVEGYYLRSEEALLLTHANSISPLVCSFVFMICVITYTDFLVSRVPEGTLFWMLPLLWAGGYFLIVTAHIAMWVNIYQVHVKMAGYHMGRLH